MFKQLFTIASLSFLAFGKAMPAHGDYKDVGVTKLDIKAVELPQHDTGFLITVSREDDLFEKATGKQVAERLTAIRLSFVVRDSRLLCNGMHIPVGISDKHVEAQIITGFTPESIPKADELRQEFDKGIVGISFDVKASEVYFGGMKLRRLFIKEKVTEVNGEKVRESEFVQHIMDVYPDGHFMAHHPNIIKTSPLGLLLAPGQPDAQHDHDHHHHHHSHHHHHEDHHHHHKHEATPESDFQSYSPRKTIELLASSDNDFSFSQFANDALQGFAEWFYSLHPILRGFLAGLSTMTLFVSVFSLVQIILHMVYGNQYEKVQFDLESNVKSMEESKKFYKAGNHSDVSTVNLLAEQDK
jgi:hypothetical protein